ncbi:disease resistance protein RGA2 isoform X1 [Brachypodium distachyon]|uniref:Rx N-terminal domain-containing protein n=1 Tax=Brachypodium distachyon TaxID=15368 RepID=I1GWR7_BRADI|nr:disease resistance protein RGA2 isoform X1 [Brachypodium distachyon]KQK17428.1 hypothetical protein BRADI_1g34407v3 [Brachypodium distachyon]|eukprot:XP_024311617.1 disease resistance protein RGA2 isoform X1 [Brachypodium distachyon]
MDLAISAITEEEKVERLQQLLLRVCTVMEEADGRYITNSCMLIQLKTIAAAMYQGHHVLDNIRCRQHKDGFKEPVSKSFFLSVSIPFKRPRTTGSSSTNKAFNLGLYSALQKLEAVVANIVEFVVLLGGCERISPRPYDTYLHVENFMFGRHVEKQQITSFLLQDNMPGPPAVLPIVGRRGVGKKTLVAHVCNYDRVRSHFSKILHLNGDDIFRITDHERLSGRVLVVVEFVSDINDDEWTKFYSSVRRMNGGSKVIIFGRNEELKRFGTTRPVSLNCLPFAEYRYLLRTLAFGSANPIDHPQLLSIVEEFAMVLDGSLIPGNLIAHAMRKNQNARFWLLKLNGLKTTIEMSKSRFGVHPNVLFDRGHPVQLKGHYLLSAPSCLVPSDSAPSNIPRKDLPNMKFGEEPGHIIPPKEDFKLISWESRLPPYTSFVHQVQFAPSCVGEKKPGAPLSGKKRRGLFGCSCDDSVITNIPN